MILTGVTLVGWADVPDSYQGDFRRRVPSTYLVSRLSVHLSICPLSHLFNDVSIIVSS